METIVSEHQGTTVEFSWDGRVLDVFGWLALTLSASVSREPE